MPTQIQVERRSQDRLTPEVPGRRRLRTRARWRRRRPLSAELRLSSRAARKSSHATGGPIGRRPAAPDVGRVSAVDRTRMSPDCASADTSPEMSDAPRSWATTSLPGRRDRSVSRPVVPGDRPEIPASPWREDVRRRRGPSASLRTGLAACSRAPRRFRCGACRGSPSPALPAACR